MNNKLIEIQKMLINAMRKLDTEEENISREVMRNNALSNSATTFIKSINLNIRIKELAEKNAQIIQNLNDELGITNEE